MDKKPRSLYLDIASEATLPLSKRKACISGRNGVHKIPRRYHLQAAEIIQLKKEMQEVGHFISPYGEGRIYTYVIRALVLLGVNKSHLFTVVYEKFIEITSGKDTEDGEGLTLWDRFSKKTARNLDTGRDPLGKFMQNLEVLQRLGGDHPYALKLAQVGACIDILKDQDQQILVQLKTGIIEGEDVHPVNMNRKRTYTKTVTSVPSGILSNISSEC